jgi:hypothetical protein
MKLFKVEQKQKLTDLKYSTHYSSEERYIPSLFSKKNIKPRKSADFLIFVTFSLVLN